MLNNVIKLNAPGRVSLSFQYVEIKKKAHSLVSLYLQWVVNRALIDKTDRSLLKILKSCYHFLLMCHLNKTPIKTSLHVRHVGIYIYLPCNYR